jgi:hypothetical protein
MSSPSLSLTFLPALILLLGVGGSAIAQGGNGPSDPFETDPLGQHSRQLARDKFELTDANPQEVARALLEKARAGFEAQMDLFVAGKTMHTAVLEWSVRLLEAETRLGGAKEPPLAALGAHWLRTRQIEEILRAKHEAGSIGAILYHEGRYYRLDAEIAWARAARGKAVLRGGPVLPGEDVTGARGLARIAFEASQSDPQALALLKLQAAREALAGHWDGFLSGRSTVEPLLEAAIRVVEAERAAQDNPDAAAHFRRLWGNHYEAHRLLRSKYEAGSIPLSDLADAAYHFFDNEFNWAKARAAPDKKARWTANEPLFPHDILEAPEVREIAKAKFEATQTTAATAARARLEAARTALAERQKEFLAGKTFAALVLEWLPRLVEAERAVLGDRADLPGLLAERWTRARQVEVSERARYEAGSIPVTSYLLALYARLDAELAWLQGVKKTK